MRMSNNDQRSDPEAQMARPQGRSSGRKASMPTSLMVQPIRNGTAKSATRGRGKARHVALPLTPLTLALVTALSAPAHMQVTGRAPVSLERYVGLLKPGMHPRLLDSRAVSKANADTTNRNHESPEATARAGRPDSLQERLQAVVEALQGSLQRTDRLIARLDQEIVSAPTTAVHPQPSQSRAVPVAKSATTNGSRKGSELPSQLGSIDFLQERLLAVFDTLQGTLQRTDRLIAHIDQDIVPEVAPLRDSRQSFNTRTWPWPSSLTSAPRAS